MKSRLKTFRATLRFTGLTGEYTTQHDVQAAHAEAARKKAAKVIGNRDGYVVTVVEFLPMGGR